MLRLKPTEFVKVLMISSLVLSPIAQAQRNNNNGGNNNGNTGCTNNCPGNSGGGVGNTAPGNQGNTGSNGNAGGATSNSNGTGSSNGGGTATGSATGGMSGGNNGNGVGNTGPGNQGNTGSNGNAGGTTGSSVGGTTGSTGNATGNGNGGGTTGSSTGGFSGGNNGNGVGNTGPGNQGNDSSNGNAGGTTGTSRGGAQGGGTTGNAQGNSRGGAQGGGTTGNAQGNSRGGAQGGGTQGGGTTGNAQGNSQGGTQGNAQGNSQGGTQGNAQGNSQGGTQGNAQGNSQGGTQGNAQGNSQGGTQGNAQGNAQGGTNGNAQGNAQGNSQGGTSGEVEGGSEGGYVGGTEGGSEGGSQGGTEGGSQGGTEGGSTGETAQESKPERKLKGRLLPLAYGNYDILTKAVNLTGNSATEVNSVNGEYPVMLDDYRAGFQVTQIRAWNAGLGLAPQLYLSNASGLAALTTGIAGIAVTKNRFVQYERFASDKNVDSLNVLPIPFKVETLNDYVQGESVYYENTGGLLYIGGVGVAGAFAGGSMVSEGGWKTLVAKTGADKAVVQIAKTSVKSTSLFTGVAVIKVDSSKVQQLNQGFTYEFDFKVGGAQAVEAYEAMLTGNLTIAQELGKTAFATGVTPVNAYTNREVSRRRGGFIGIPMVALFNWSTGRTVGETATLTYTDKTSTDMNYGIFFKEQKGRFFHKHKSLLRSFSSGVAVTKNEASKVVGIEEKATFVWQYESDNSTSRKLNDVVSQFHRDLGVSKAFSPVVPSGKDLGFVRLEAKIDISAGYTRTMIGAMQNARSLEIMRETANNMIDTYLAQGDRDDLCTNDETEMKEAKNACENRLKLETRSALSKIRSTLLTISEKKDAAEYTAAYANMGRELIRNQFVLNSFFLYDQKCESKFDIKLEGRRLNKMAKLVPANMNCR